MKRQMVLAVVTLLAVGCAGPQTPDLPSASRPSSTVKPTEAPRAFALTESGRLVSLVAVPSGGIPQGHAPVPALARAPSEPASRYLVDVARWWVLPLSMSEAFAWVQAHPPSGLEVSAHGSGNGAGGPFSYISYADAPTAAYTDPTLVIEVVSDGGGDSAIRADGQTLWVPHRPAAEQVPTEVSQVRLIAYRGGGAARPTHILAHRTVTGAAAARLVRLANELSRDNRGVLNCAFDTGLRIGVTFVAPENTLVFTEVPACGSVSVTTEGNAQPGLLNSSAFHRVLMEYLRLRRAHYRSRS